MSRAFSKGMHPSASEPRSTQSSHQLFGPKNVETSYGNRERFCGIASALRLILSGESEPETPVEDPPARPNEIEPVIKPPPGTTPSRLPSEIEPQIAPPPPSEPPIEEPTIEVPPPEIEPPVQPPSPQSPPGKNPPIVM